MLCLSTLSMQSAVVWLASEPKEDVEEKIEPNEKSIICFFYY